MNIEEVMNLTIEQAFDFFENNKIKKLLQSLLGLSDVIMDIVETGTTLRENDLEVIEEVLPISARLIANKAGYRFKYEAVKELERKIANGKG